jgi:hypothetical protein
LRIDLYEEKEYITAIDADQFREDLREAGYGKGRHAFRIQTPPQLKDGRAHILSISVAGTKRTIATTPPIVVCHETER